MEVYKVGVIISTVEIVCNCIASDKNITFVIFRVKGYKYKRFTFSSIGQSLSFSQPKQKFEFTLPTPTAVIRRPFPYTHAVAALLSPQVKMRI